VLADTEYGADTEPADMRQDLGKVLVISPHLDDGVLSCADVVARNPGAIVLTIFAGAPAEDQPLEHWDRLAGFRSGAEAIRLRKEEDDLALFLLDAVPVWLDFLDAQYGSSPRSGEVAAALEDCIRVHSPDTVLFPLGLFHSDHRLAAEASLRLCGRYAERRWIAYADALYRAIPQQVETRIAELHARGWRLQALEPPEPAGVKRRAAGCYASQLRALATPGHVPLERLFEREQYWAVRRST
jgi:LmbE family N-acetylglucosaminyl deacetylase